MSVWAVVSELALIELGYTDEDIEKRTINLAEGENFKLSFLEINPNATLPTPAVKDKAHISTAKLQAIWSRTRRSKSKLVLRRLPESMRTCMT